MPLYNFRYSGRTQRITIPRGFKRTATAWLWGGAGGGGGNDAGISGGSGACGNAVKIEFEIAENDVIEFAVGQGGTFGSSNSAGSNVTRTTTIVPDAGWNAVTNYAWGSFMNTYAIWSGGANEAGTKSFTTQFNSSGGLHTIEIASDNSSVNSFGPHTGLRAGGNFTRSSGIIFTKEFPTGLIDFTIQVTNDSGGGNNPGGIAVVVKNPSGTIVWTTRMYVAGTYSYSTTTFVPARTGGTGGSGYIDASNNRYGGGNGGVAGPNGASGSGGGGGAATVLLLNGTLLAVAGGGGGGGGAGVAASNGVAASATPSSDNINTVGQNGQAKSGDGGGGGGGGGGQNGGRRGTTPSGDVSALPGGTGVSYTASIPGTVISSATYTGRDTVPPGVDSFSVGPTFATGGTAGAAGTDGYLVLQLEPLSLPYVKQGGEWESTENLYIKAGGSWVEIIETYVKVGGRWRQVQQDSLAPATQLSQDFRFGTGGTRS